MALRTIEVYGLAEAENLLASATPCLVVLRGVDSVADAPAMLAVVETLIGVGEEEEEVDQAEEIGESEEEEIDYSGVEKLIGDGKQGLDSEEEEIDDSDVEKLIGDGGMLTAKDGEKLMSEGEQIVEGKLIHEGKEKLMGEGEPIVKSKLIHGGEDQKLIKEGEYENPISDGGEVNLTGKGGDEEDEEEDEQG